MTNLTDIVFLLQIFYFVFFIDTSFSISTFLSLSSEHQELALLIQDQASTAAPEAIGDLEKELQHLVERLENKMEQIDVVRHLMASCTTKRGKTKKCTRGAQGYSSTAVHIPENGEVEIVTTVRPKSKTHPAEDEEEVHSSDCQSSSQESLQMLRKMKQLQHTLQRDDLSWK